MTLVGFYVLQTDDPEKRLHTAMRLTEKAFRQGNRVFLNAGDRNQAQWLDEQLWSFRQSSFLPHALAGEGGSEVHEEPIVIGWGQSPSGSSELLINLQLEVPAFFGRFARVAEIVTQDEKSLEALRTSWKFYKDRGYQLEKHTL